jgi:hypothetical protein
MTNANRKKLRGNEKSPLLGMDVLITVFRPFSHIWTKNKGKN